MKVCDNCGRLVMNKTKICPSCEGEKFKELLVSSYDDIEPYLEDNDG